MTAAANIDYLSSIPEEVLQASGPYGRAYDLQLKLSRANRFLDQTIEILHEDYDRANRAQQSRGGFGFLNAPEDLIDRNPVVIAQRAAIADLTTQVQAAQTELGGIVFLPAIENLEKIQQKFAALNRKGLGEPITFTPSQETLVLNYKLSDEDTRGYDFAHVFAVLSGTTPKIDGYEFLASVVPTEAGNLVKRIPVIAYGIRHGINDANPEGKLDSANSAAGRALDAIDLSRFHHTGAICEHCNKIRSRKDCYVIYNETTGESLQVGRTCLRDYMGSNDPERIVKALEQLQEIMRFAASGGVKPVHTTMTFLTHCAAVLRVSGDPKGLGRDAATNIWLKATEKKDRQGLPEWIEPIEADTTAAKAVLHFAREEWTETGSFAESVKIALANDFIDERMYGYAGAIFAARQRWLAEKTERERREAQQAERKPVIEGRIEITGEVISAKWRDNGFGEVLKLTIRDDRGFTVWGSAPSSLVGEVERGARITFTASVEKSRDDETFGWFKRPTKATIIEVANA